MPAHHFLAVPRWDVTDRPDVSTIVDRVSRRLAHELHLDAADLSREALIRVATAGDLIECNDGDNLGLLAYRVGCDLLDIARRELVVRDRQDSLDLRIEPTEERPPEPVSLPQRRDTVDRTMELVDALLPAV